MYGVNNTRRGFALIELAIVLVIVGLLVGGLLLGRALIRSAELLSVVTDEQTFISAVNTFRNKYGGIPGDLANATSFWGTDPGGCPNSCGPACYSTAQVRTCNGDGNSLIQNDGEGETNDTPMYENFRAWQQLSNAGMVRGAYTGTNGPASWADNQPRLNIPDAKIGGGGFEWAVFDSSNVYANYPTAKVGVQYLLVGMPDANGYDLTGPLFLPMDARSIDAKIDDGVPETGLVIANGGSAGGNCTTPMWSPTGNYNVSYGTPACALLFQVKAW